MANLNIEIQISARDQASSVLKGIQGSLGAIGGFARGALALGFGAATAAAGALGVGLGISIREAMEAQEVQAQLANVLRSTGGVAGVTADMANELANSLMGVTRFGDEAILSGENMLLTFTNIGKDVFPEATEVMLDMSQALGQDIKSSAIQLGKALQDPIQGVTALRRVGVNFTEDQQKMIESMVESGDLMGAQKFILQELQTEFGGSARAAGETFAGQLDILKNSLLNVAEGIGTALLPIAQDFLQNTILPMLPAIQELAEKFGTLVTTLFKAGPLSSEFGEALGAMFGEETATQIQTIIGKVIDIATAIKDLIVNVIIPFVSEHAEVFKGALIAIGALLVTTGVIIPIVGALIAALTSPITLIVAAVALLGAAWATNFLGIRTAVIEFWDNTALPALSALRAWLAENIPVAIERLKAFWVNVLQPAIQTVWSWMSSVLIPFLSNLAAQISGNFSKAIQFWANIWNNVLLPAIRAVWSFIQTDVIPLLQALWNLIQVSGALAVQIISGLWRNVLKPALETVWTFIKDNVLPILNRLWTFIRDTLGPIISGLVNGALANLRSAFQSVRDAIQWVIDKIAALIAKLSSVRLPDWVTRQSPSQFEMTFIGASEAIRRLYAVDLPRLQLSLAQSSPASNISTAQHFNLTIYSNARREDLVSDFGLMRALAEG